MRRLYYEISHGLQGWPVIMKLIVGTVIYSIVGVLVVLFLGYTTIYHGWLAALPNADKAYEHGRGMFYYWMTAISLVVYIGGLIWLIRRISKKLNSGFLK